MNTQLNQLQRLLAEIDSLMASAAASGLIRDARSCAEKARSAAAKAIKVVVELDTQQVNGVLLTGSGAFGKLPPASSEVRTCYPPSATSAAQAGQMPDSWKSGAEAVAAMIEKKAENYATEYGHDDLGALSFGTGYNADVKSDHHSTLVELAEEIRAFAAAPQPVAAVPQTWLDVQAERRRQVEAEGWTLEHDDQHDPGELARAAAAYLLYAYPRGNSDLTFASRLWPWVGGIKPRGERRDMLRGTALGLAALERFDRTAAPAQGGDV